MSRDDDDDLPILDPIEPRRRRRRRRRRRYDEPEDDELTRMLLPVGRSGWAIAAGYLGLISILLLPAPFAVFCSIKAIQDIRRNEEKSGMGRAIFGLVLGGLFSLLLVVLLIGLLIESAR